MNMAKHFRKNKQYKEARICWEELVGREDNNVTFRVRLFETLLKVGDSDEAKLILMEIKTQQALPEKEIVELERKLMLLKAREE